MILREYILEVNNGKLFLPHEVSQKIQGKNLVLTGMGEYIEIRTETQNQGSDDSFCIEKEFLELLMNSETDTIHNTCQYPGKKDNLSCTNEMPGSRKKAGRTHGRNQRDISRLLYLGTYDIMLEDNALFLPGKYAELYEKRNSNPRVALRVYDDRIEIRNI